MIVVLFDSKAGLDLTGTNNMSFSLNHGGIELFNDLSPSELVHNVVCQPDMVFVPMSPLIIPSPPVPGEFGLVPNTLNPFPQNDMKRAGISTGAYLYQEPYCPRVIF